MIMLQLKQNTTMEELPWVSAEPANSIISAKAERLRNGANGVPSASLSRGGAPLARRVDGSMQSDGRPLAQNSHAPQNTVKNVMT